MQALNHKDPAKKTPSTPGAYALPKLCPVIPRLMLAESCKRATTLQEAVKPRCACLAACQHTTLWTWHTCKQYHATQQLPQKEAVCYPARRLPIEGSTASLNAAHSRARNEQPCNPLELRGMAWKKRHYSRPPTTLPKRTSTFSSMCMQQQIICIQRPLIKIL